MKFQLTAVGLACATLLAACGGGGGGADTGAALNQAVSFPFPGGPAVAAPPDIQTIQLSATASSGLPITYVSNTPSVCTVSGNIATLLAAGECSLDAKQLGGEGYIAASSRQLFVVPKQPTTIFFRNPGPLPLDANPVELGATSNVTTIPLVLTTSTPTVCTVSGTTLQKLTDGLCTVKATLDGGDIFETMTVEKTIPIGSALAPALTFLSGYKSTVLSNEDGRIDPRGGSSESRWFCDNRCTTSISADGSSFTNTFTWDKVNPYPNGEKWWRVWTETAFFAPKTGQLSGVGHTWQGVRIDAQAALKFNFATNQEWLDTGDSNVELDLVLGHFILRSNRQGCNVRLRATFKPTSAAPTDYSIKLSDFQIQDKCDTDGLIPMLEMQDYPVVQMQFASGAGNFKVQTPDVATPNFVTRFTFTGPIFFE